MPATVLDLIRSITGADCGALPLSLCTLPRPYLLERQGLSATEGTVCMMAIPYVMTEDVDDPRRNLSLYAVPRDYHLFFDELKASLIPALQAAYPQRTFALFADHSPVGEIQAAARAGLGTVGMNGLLITPRYGSFVFLGEVITDATWEEVAGADAPLPDPSTPLPTCEGCGACVRACPAGCNEGDRTSCLSALTQKKGALTPEEATALDRHPPVWGCDVCQTACPHNRRVICEDIDTPIPFFREERIIRMDAATLATMSDEDFAHRAYAWRGRGVIGRNIQRKETAERSTT